MPGFVQTFDVISTPKPINVAYSTVGLDFHMDLIYYESPPGLQFLHCLRYDERMHGLCVCVCVCACVCVCVCVCVCARLIF